MATEQPLAPSVTAASTGDPEKTMHDLEHAMSNTKLQNTAFIPDPAVATSEEDKEKKMAESTPTINGGAVTNGTNGTATEHTPAFDSTLPLSSKDNPVRTPLRAPLETSKPKPRPDLTADQNKKYNEFLSTVSAWTEVPDSLANNASKSPIQEYERMFMTRDCLLRYLRADKWNMSAAETRLRNTLAWRREYGVDKKLTPEYISVENETGKQLVVGWDNESRPCWIMRPSKQNTERGPRQIEHMVFMLERAIDLSPAGQETLTLLINFAETKSGQGATMAQGRQTLWILQNHYPERLGRALITNVPFMIWGFFKLITPFIDPLTKEKIKFNEDSGLHVPRDQLVKECGGNVEFDYEHDKYWPALIKLAKQKREEQKARWEKGGKRVGEYESYLKGGQEECLADIEKKTVSATEA